jgi:WD40 repeat protein
MTPRFTAWLPLLVVGLTSTTSRAGEEAKTAAEVPFRPYVVEGAVGPSNVSFPWHVAFSPDGRWIAFADGHAGTLSIVDAKTGVEAWPRGKGVLSPKRVAFARDSRRLAAVATRYVLVLALGTKGWAEEANVPLERAVTISARNSPDRVEFTPDEKAVLFLDDERLLKADLGTKKVTPVPGAEKDVFDARQLPDGRLAVSRREPFETTVIAADGKVERHAAVLLEASADGHLWLVATDPKRFNVSFRDGEVDPRLALAVWQMPEAKVLGTLVLTGGRKPGDSYAHRHLIAATFSSDGRLLATAEGVGPLVIRDARTLRPLQTIREYESVPYPMGAAFSRDGEWLVTGGRRDRVGDAPAPHTLLWKRASAK